jgi:kumamolisin
VGQTIGLIELAGGFRSEQLAAYFATIGIAMPAVTTVSVDGARNSPEGSPNGADGEVYGNIEIAASTAPDAHIVVYFGPNTDAGFLDAVKAAIHDETNKPSVILIGWGKPEAQWAGSAINAMNQAFEEAATLGITVCVAAGDRAAVFRVKRLEGATACDP